MARRLPYTAQKKSPQPSSIRRIGGSHQIAEQTSDYRTRRSEGRRTSRVFLARYTTSCVVCAQDIAIGEQIRAAGSSRKDWAHRRCSVVKANELPAPGSAVCARCGALAKRQRILFTKCKLRNGRPDLASAVTVTSDLCERHLVKLRQGIGWQSDGFAYLLRRPVAVDGLGLNTGRPGGSGDLKPMYRRFAATTPNHRYRTEYAGE